MLGDLGGGSAVNKEKPYLSLSVGKQTLDPAKKILVVLAFRQIMRGIVVLSVASVGNLSVIQGKEGHHSFPGAFTVCQAVVDAHLCVMPKGHRRLIKIIGLDRLPKDRNDLGAELLLGGSGRQVSCAGGIDQRRILCKQGGQSTLVTRSSKFDKDADGLEIRLVAASDAEKISRK